MIACLGEVLIDCLPEKNVIGGAPFNVAINLKRFNQNVEFISHIGDDEFGKMIYDLAQKEKIASSISISNQLPTGYVSVDFVENEPKYTIHENTAWQSIDFKNLNQSPDYFVFGSLATFFVDNKTTLLKYRNAYPQALYICDLNIRPPFISEEHILFCLEHSDFLKINEDECQELKRILKVSSTLDLFEKLSKDYHIPYTLLTEGSKGATFYDGNIVSDSPKSIPTHIFKDAIGAGDGFLAAFLNEWTENNNPQTALKEALKHASKICQNEGAIL